MVQLSIQLLHVTYTHRDSRYHVIILLFVLLSLCIINDEHNLFVAEKLSE